TVLVLQPVTDAEHAAHPAHVLTEQKRLVITRERDAERVLDGLHHGSFAHGRLLGPRPGVSGHGAPPTPRADRAPCRRRRARRSTPAWAPGPRRPGGRLRRSRR